MTLRYVVLKYISALINKPVIVLGGDIGSTYLRLTPDFLAVHYSLCYSNYKCLSSATLCRAVSNCQQVLLFTTTTEYSFGLSLSIFCTVVMDSDTGMGEGVLLLFIIV